MPRKSTTKSSVAFALTGIALAGALVGAWRYHARYAELRRELLDDARRLTVAFGPAELGGLSEARTLTGTLPEAAVRDRLKKVRLVDARVRSAFLFRWKPEADQILILAQSGDPAGDNSTADFRERTATPTPGIREIVRTGQPVTETAATDRMGRWMTAYVPLGVAEGSKSTPADFLGLDVDINGWRKEVWQSALESAVFVGLALGLPLVAWYVARRQVEQRHVIRNLSEAVEQSHSAIMIVGLDGRIEFANRGLCEQIGYSRHELIGRKWQDLRVAEAPDKVPPDFTSLQDSGQPWEGEWLNQRQNGTVYPVRGVVTPVKRRDGGLACYVVVFDDATEARDREAELREARDLAQAGDRAKGHFLATMSHEVRTPLNGIVGFTSLLLDTPLSSEQREYVQTIRMSTEALIQLTGDILDFARIESGKLKLDPLACDPRECIEDALDLLAPKADAKTIELLHRIADDVPAAVMTDGGRLRQVLANLIGNAIKFTDRGEVEVSVRRLPAVDEMPGTSVPPMDICVLEFTVRDTGIGIASEHHAKLFRAFTQVDESTTRRYGGTGLGLAICRNLVELMGGTIGLESEPGQGSTFKFTVRAAVAAPVPAKRSLEGLRLGLVVQTPGLRREISDLLSGWSAEVLEANHPDELATARADIVLIEVSEAAARELTTKPAPLFVMPPDKLLGLVPITLPNELRTGLRAHVRLLVNKPVHQDGFFALLAGSLSSMPSPTSPPHFGFRVLLVDDDAVNQRLVQRALTSLGCLPTPADNGRHAIELLERRPSEFDLVLLDMHMPDLDGNAVLREIRAGKAGVQAQSIWIIALTADTQEDQRARGMAAGLNDYLTKPLKQAELEEALRTFRAQRAAGKVANR
jgi:PAS domain S-box-containing protein